MKTKKNETDGDDNDDNDDDGHCTPILRIFIGEDIINSIASELLSSDADSLTAPVLSSLD